MAESFAETDRHPPTFDPATHSGQHSRAVQEVVPGLAAGRVVPRRRSTEDVGGVPAPSMVAWAINELALGAQPAVFMYTAGPIMANVMLAHRQRAAAALGALAIERGWGATMVLTEPDAGSDVGAGRTKAIPQPDGTWHLDGRQAVHHQRRHRRPVREHRCTSCWPGPRGPDRARRDSACSWSRSSMFDPQTGEPGERNGVFVTGLEHKMGLKASATSELAFGQHGTPAVGWLVNDTHNGIAQMFKVIEYARMMVGTKAIATLSTGYLNALEYAKVACPGRRHDPDDRQDRAAGDDHPPPGRAPGADDAEGLRRRSARAVPLHRRASGPRRSPQIVSGADAEMAERVNDLLLPIVKGVGSERAYQCLTESLQTLGGSGFLQDYPIEQYIRDAKIDSLYEGTTAIQAQDFFFRKIARDQGGALMHVVAQIREVPRRRRGAAGTGRGACTVGDGRSPTCEAMVATMTDIPDGLASSTLASSIGSGCNRSRSCSRSATC